MANGNEPLEPKVLWYVLSFLIWPLGIILGIIYMSKPEPEVKAFGKNCLIAAIIFILLCVLCYVIFGVLKVAGGLFW
jgi:hypothetical protein